MSLAHPHHLPNMPVWILVPLGASLLTPFHDLSALSKMALSSGVPIGPGKELRFNRRLPLPPACGLSMRADPIAVML